jgi:thioredoxin-related protein
MKFRHITILILFIVVSGCVVEKDQNKDLKNLLNEIQVMGGYTIGITYFEAIGWNDSTLTGTINIANRDILRSIMAASEKVSPELIGFYTPLKNSQLVEKLSVKELPQLWLYKSKKHIGCLMYFIVEENKLFFDLHQY